MLFEIKIMIVSKINFLAKSRRNKMRRNLKNNDITFLCPNCIGGIIFHDLGLKFMSPTVNLMLTQTDFVKYISNLDEYNNGKFEFFDYSEYKCPCARLSVPSLDTITVCFTHYADPQNAENKWNERKERINKDNLFVFLEERDGITFDEIKALSDLNLKGLVVFTAHKYDLPYTVYIDKYNADGEVGNILRKNHLTESREYEKYFDFVKWFNEADGGNYDVSKFII